MIRIDRKVLLIIECAVLFVALPMLFYFEPVPLPKIPFLLAVFLYCLIVLRNAGLANRLVLWSSGPVLRWLPGILLRSAVIAAALIVFVKIRYPGMLFAFPRANPYIWAIVMVLYPVLSAYPQELVFRTFFFRRYERLFTRPCMRAAVSSFAFSFLHIMYDNPFAVVSTLIGGLIFSVQYERSKSLAVATLEHAIYGCLVFSVGLGTFFYEG